MSSGLIAILDDVVALAKVAAASVDDVAAQAADASSRAVGIVIDDAAVTPRYAVGFAADRELPIIGKIALGSLWNKLVLLLPGALVLSAFAPWLITPLLMAGGVYLCLEGYEKVAELFEGDHVEPDDTPAPKAANAKQFEQQKVNGAIRTDFILSAEIMAITLASLPEGSFWMKAAVLAAVGIGMTVLVYGVVAIIVKADDAGLALARSSSALLKGIGRGIVKGMPGFLAALSFVGMLAMLWVGGGIIVHGLAALGLHGPDELIHHLAHAAAEAVPSAHAVVNWLAGATLSGLFGLAIGAVAAPLTHHLLAPLIALVTGSAARH